MNMMSEAQFWWDHLTYPQQQFIIEYGKRFINAAELGRVKSIEAYYQNREIFHILPGWPETNMRVV